MPQDGQNHAWDHSSAAAQAPFFTPLHPSQPAPNFGAFVPSQADSMSPPASLIKWSPSPTPELRTRHRQP